MRVASERNLGIFRIKSVESIPRLAVGDVRDDLSVPLMDTFREANFPCTYGAWRERDRTSAHHPKGPGETTAKSEPVLVVQATFITGGLVLRVVGQHGTMDKVGMPNVESHLA